MKYLAKFHGRKVNAIGICYDIETHIVADNEDKARLKLYDEYEHIFRLTLTPCEQTT